MIINVQPSRDKKKSKYRKCWIFVPKIVQDRSTGQVVRVWGGGMFRRWSKSERRWFYRSVV